MHSIRRIIRPRETSRRTGYSISQIWRLEKKSKFPQRVQLSDHSVGHYEDEVDDWIRSRIRGGARPVRAPRSET
jgi:predicted DNA-binding transcriptional regulator AlpA